jgi:hypothetical protein
VNSVHEVKVSELKLQKEGGWAMLNSKAVIRGISRSYK